jgi:putative lipoprotein (rSAM/lipoprotein system)
MKKIKVSFWRRYNTIITLLLSLLGFSTACESLDEYGAPVVEYGSPTATFIVKGNVLSPENNSIPNIRVTMWGDTTYTDENGAYEVKKNSFPQDQDIPVQFEDIDGIENNEYAKLDTLARFEDVTFTGGEGWNAGEAERQLNVKMKPKE